QPGDRRRAPIEKPTAGPWIFGPFLSPLLALQDCRNLPGDRAVVRLDGDQRSAQAGLGGNQSGQMDSALGEGPNQRDDRQSSRLVSLAATGLGRADPRFYVLLLPPGAGCCGDDSACCFDLG